MANFEVQALRARLERAREDRERLELEIDRLNAKVFELDEACKESFAEAKAARKAAKRAAKAAAKAEAAADASGDNESLNALVEAAASSVATLVPIGKARKRATEFAVVRPGPDDEPWQTIKGQDAITFFTNAGQQVGHALRAKSTEPLMLGGRIRWVPPGDHPVWGTYTNEARDAAVSATNIRNVALGRLEIGFKFDEDLFDTKANKRLCHADYMESYLGIEPVGARPNYFAQGRRAFCEGVVIGYQNMDANQIDIFLEKSESYNSR